MRLAFSAGEMAKIANAYPAMAPNPMWPNESTPVLPTYIWMPSTMMASIRAIVTKRSAAAPPNHPWYSSPRAMNPPNSNPAPTTGNATSRRKSGNIADFARGWPSWVRATITPAPRGPR